VTEKGIEEVGEKWHEEDDDKGVYVWEEIVGDSVGFHGCGL
jgi:hypothetical protein